MPRTFYIVGPTATGKSELAADVARELDTEIVSADAFQIYRGLDLLTAKPDPATLAKAPHHLIGIMPILEEMNAEKFRTAATRAISEIHLRGKLAIIVGGSGLYIKALTHGLSPLPAADPKLRAKLDALSLEDLGRKLTNLDPQAARRIDSNNRRRLVRAIEICLRSGKPVSAQHSPREAILRISGCFVFRHRDELYDRINRRVEMMFENGVIEEVRAIGAVGTTASQMIGFPEIRQLLDGKISLPQCIAAIQQATRRYAKRQLTWFRRQTTLESLNLSLFAHNDAVKWVSQKARLASALGND